MLRTCPKCGDYYADELLAFCLADGTPLVNVDPLDESWDEGTRVVKEKADALRKRARRGKRWRVLRSAATVMVVTVAVRVVSVNSIVYIKPKPREVVLAQSSPHETPTPAPPREQKECSNADRSRERESILGRYADGWRRKIEEERRKIIAENVSDGVAAEAILSPIEYTTTFEMCVVGQVIARYKWQIRANYNGTIKEVIVAKKKMFTCVKGGGEWGCF